MFQTLMPLPKHVADIELARRKSAGDDEFGIQVGGRDAHVRARLVQERLARADVGPLADELGRQPQRQFRRQAQVGEAHRRDLGRRGRLAHIAPRADGPPARIARAVGGSAGLGLRDQRPLVLHGEPRHAARPIALARRSQARWRCAATMRSMSSICAAQRRLADRRRHDVAGERQPRRLELVGLVVDLRRQRLQLAARSAEDVEVVRGVDAEAEHVERTRVGRLAESRTSRGRCAAAPRPRSTSTCGYWVAPARAARSSCACDEPRARLVERRAARERPLHQRVDLGRAEHRPPLGGNVALGHEAHRADRAAADRTYSDRPPADRARGNPGRPCSPRQQHARRAEAVRETIFNRASSDRTARRSPSRPARTRPAATGSATGRASRCP